MFYAKRGKTARIDYDDGSRSITMTPELEQAFEEQRRLFIEKSGREPGPNDPIFFDPDADSPQFITRQTRERLTEQVVEAMRKAGFDEGYIYAYRKTVCLLPSIMWV